MTTVSQSAPALQATPPLRATTAAPGRALALDALRGFAILTMVLSGVVPHGGALPAWMYHAQTPPPTHKFIQIPGITWVDLVFPFFLFALGAAVPFALGRRMEKGMTDLQAVWVIAKRSFLLCVFSIFQAHVGPGDISKDPTASTYLLTLAGFAIMFAVLVRLPDSWPPAARWAVRIAGWGGGVCFAWFVKFTPLDSTGTTAFCIARNNIILVILTGAAFSGSLVWLFTRRNLLARLGVLGVLMAMRLAGNDPGWVAWFKAQGPVVWALHLAWSAGLGSGTWAEWLKSWDFIANIFNFGLTSYLFIVIPGTIAGDLLSDWLKSRPLTGEGGRAVCDWSARRLRTIAGLMFAFLAVCLVGLFSRMVGSTVVACAAMCLLGWWFFRDPPDATSRLLRQLYGWGVYWLILGLFFEPYEGGIKKDSATMSYYFVTAGLALFLLIAFTIIIDIRGRRLGVNLLVANGQNPMIAYVGGGEFLAPLLALTTLGPRIQTFIEHNNAVLGTIWAFVFTLAVACIVAAFTRYKVFWRT